MEAAQEGCGEGSRLIGADGCPGGWMVATESASGEIRLQRRRTAELLAASRRESVVAAVLDVPIGLRERGPRRCDLEARRHLGPGRGSSVFPAPSRGTLGATTYAEAQRLQRAIDGRGVSRQAYGIHARVALVDRQLRALGPGCCLEGHPELTFQRLAGGVPIGSKHTVAGRRARQELLSPHFELACELDSERAGSADSLDALACLACARDIARGRPSWVPGGPDEVDPLLRRVIRIYY